MIIAAVDFLSVVVAGIVAIILVARAVGRIRVLVIIDLILLGVVSDADIGPKIIPANVVAARVNRNAEIWLGVAIVVLTLVTRTIIKDGAAIFHARMFADVGLVVTRCVVVEERPVAVDGIDAELPNAASAIDGAVEIFRCDKTLILTACEHITQIVVAVIQQVIILIDSIAVAVNDIVHDAVDLIDVVEVDFENVIILRGAEVKLVCHSVAQESRMIANGTCTESKHLGDSHQSQHEAQHNLFHSRMFYRVNDSLVVLVFAIRTHHKREGLNGQCPYLRFIHIKQNHSL